MKLGKFLFAGAFGVAIIASFAFKQTNRDDYQVYFWRQAAPLQCAVGPMDQDDCSPAGEGAQCTVYDWTVGGGVNRPAYKYYDAAPCYQPLYHEF